MIVRHNRAYVDLELQRKNGTQRTARFWVDNGNPEFSLSEALARDLGLDLSRTGKNQDGMAVALVDLPGVLLGGMRLQTGDASAVVLPEKTHAFAENDVDGVLSSRVLQQYEVRFDYLRRRFTLAQPGALKSKGIRIPCTIQPRTGMAQIRATFAGTAYQVAVDMGSAFTLVREDLARGWAQANPQWPQIRGAVGEANMFGAPFEAHAIMLRMPQIELGSARLANAPVVGLPKDFFDWYSRKTAQPVSAIIGGNLLKRFRFVIDYPNRAVYIERQTRVPKHEFDLVGLVLAPSRDRDGRYGVRAVASKDGKQVVEGLEPGDKLLQVDGRDLQGESLSTVIDALRGRPGSHHRLLVQRKGKQVTINALVVSLL